MGKKTIKEQIDLLAYHESDPYMDGFVTWGCKKELYEILWYVQDKLSKCGTYEGEEEFVKNRNIDVMWNILKDEKVSKENR
jgi:hypothetical protein